MNQKCAFSGTDTRWIKNCKWILFKDPSGRDLMWKQCGHPNVDNLIIDGERCDGFQR